MKKFILVFALHLAACCPALGRTESVNGGGKIGQWRVFGPFDRFDPVPEAHVLKAMPERLALGGVELTGIDIEPPRARLDLADVLGHQDMGSVAYVFAALEAGKDGLATIGAGSDWWFQLWVDGELAHDTLDTGNNAWPVHIANHRVDVNLKKGRHIVVLRAVRGSATFDVALGGPDELRAAPENEWITAPPPPPEALSLWHEGEDAARGALLFTRARGGVFLRAIEGLQCVAFPHGDYVLPRFIPGRAEIALNSMRGGRPGIWIEEINGQGRRRVCDGRQVAVSPDGRMLVFQREGAIFRLEIASGAETLLSPLGWNSCAFPSYCPNGAILFVTAHEGQRAVFSARLEPGAAPEPMVSGEIHGVPRCSPAGGLVAFQDGAHLHLYDAATRERRRLTFAGGIQGWPVWSRDGASLLYLQSPALHDGPRHVYRIELDDPAEVALVWRDAESGFDWNGMGFASGPAVELACAPIAVWTSEKPADFSVSLRDFFKKSGSQWETGEKPRSRETMLECGWGGVGISVSKGIIMLQAWSGAGRELSAVIKLLDGGGTPHASIAAIAAVEVRRDPARVELELRSENGTPMRAALDIFRAEPVVGIVPLENIGGVVVKHDFSMAVAPDRIGDDLLYRPRNFDAGLAPALPSVPFAIGMAATGNGLIMAITPFENQGIFLEPGPSPAAFSGARMTCAGETVFVAPLAGADLWIETSTRSADSGKTWNADWTNPFPAQWRLTAASGADSFSALVLKDAPAREERFSLAGASFGSEPVSTVIYAYDRSANSRLDRMLPMDILRAVAGLEKASELAREHGARGYRLSKEWTPVKSADQALGMMSNMWRWDTPGATQRVARLCAHIIALIRGLDERMSEYEAFLEEMEVLCLGGSGADTNRFMPVMEKAADIKTGAAPIPVSEIAGLAGALPSDRNSLVNFSGRVKAAFSQRLAFLSSARKTARFARDYAGLVQASTPELKPRAERLRAIAGDILQNRHYLEGDWRGESPLDPAR